MWSASRSQTERRSGNYFWGVETFVPGDAAARGLKGKRLIAASNRDHELFVFRYTGG